jgi:hypothetical protein
MDASELIKLRRNRTNFANYIVQRQRQQDGCQLHVILESGSGSANQVSLINIIRNGATETTVAEEGRYLEEGKCPDPPIQSSIIPSPPMPPSGLPSASLWFDPSDTSNITVISNILTEFVDKTGNGNNGVSLNLNTAYNVAPINGLGTVRINNTSAITPVASTSQCLKVTNYNYNDQYISYAIVVNYRSGGSGFVATDTPGLFGRGIGCSSGKAQTISYNAFTTWDGNPISEPNITIPTNTPTIIVASISASIWTYSVNGTQYTLNLTQSKTPDNTQGLNIGCWNPTNAFNIVFDCGELLVYTSFLTSSEIEKVEGYFATKWGLLGNLPANHPYKNGYP